MKLTVQGESKEENVPVEKIYDCSLCNDNGEITVDESDGEGHYAPTGTQKCLCRLDVDTYEPETI